MLNVFGQKKSKEIDTLTQQNKVLTAKYDSVNALVGKYAVMYNVIKDSVIRYQFDPEKTGFLLDSLNASRGAASALMFNANIQSADSIKILQKQNTVLISEIDSLKTAWNAEKNAGPCVPAEELENAKAITGLKQLKELLDARIITDEEFVILKKKYIEKL